MNHEHTLLGVLAQQLGIETSYEDAWGNTVVASDETLIKLINLLGVEIKKISDAGALLKKLVIEKIENKINEVQLAWEGECTFFLYLTEKELATEIDYEIHTETGAVIQNKINLAKIRAKKMHHETLVYFEKKIKLDSLPQGYHQLSVVLGAKKFHSFVISAPKKIYSQHLLQGAHYGVFAPIYALHDVHSLGCGDLSTLAKFATWIAANGGDVVATMPFFAAFLKDHYEPSPYSPVSRMYWNELYLDLNEENAPALGTNKAGTEESIINLQKVAAFKREFMQAKIAHILAQPSVNAEFQAYVASHPQLTHYALFRAQQEFTQQAWDSWALAARGGELHLNEHVQNDYQYHLFSQWQFAVQLKELKKQINAQGQFLYLDLPVGVHKAGFDTWYYQHDFIHQASIGSPPDPVYKQGQNWGAPPLNPRAIRTNHYAYLINMLRHILPYVDILRIDHVMAFNRLYWIPEHCQPSEGAYVHYNAEEIYAILCIESHRYKTALIGENLGMVPKATNQMMKKHDMFSMHIIQYLLDSQTALTPRSEKMLASLNTHDMPTFYAYCLALDIEEQYKNQVITEKEYKKELYFRHKNINKLKKALKTSGLNTETLMQSMLNFLAQSQARLVLVNVEDLWHERYSQNIPACRDEANWCRKLAFSMEQLIRNREVNDCLLTLKKVRKQKLPPIPSSHQQGLISADDIYLFNEGKHYRLYEHLGAHPDVREGVTGINFAVWAPNANQVSVIGGFNAWEVQKNPMGMIEDSGIWETFVPQAKVGDLYKFHIQSRDNEFASERMDPFSFYQEIAPKTASIVWHSQYEWNDVQWMSTRHQYQGINSPISIYELHIGSWRRGVEENNRFLTYRELAPLLADYLVAMNFTHVEFLPVMEHPFYGSWGYQTLGYFAPSSRYGTPDDFKFLIDHLHQHHIGVILDWVPSHFPNDAHGLAFFDGTHLFEHADPKKGFHPDWKSAIFNYGRHEVKAFLISSAIFWLDKYHIDAIRVDAVASMLYLNYSRAEGEWIPNIHGGHENLEAINFLKDLNETAYHYYPDIQTFAEESTAWPGVSRPTYLGGLGFGFKWDMGWMHDTLSYLSKDPIHRRYHQYELSFRMIYAFSENFVLSLSHDEVVYGKGSLINKIPGDEWSQFAQLRLLYGYMFAMPGKKLLFMGNEFGQRSEWHHEQSLDWHLCTYPLNHGVQQWVRTLNKLYQSEPALFELEHEHAGFAWIDAQDAENSIYSFLRKSRHEELLLVILNFTPVSRHNYRIGVPKMGTWNLLVTSDASEYGGVGRQQNELIAEAIPFHNQPYSVCLDVFGFSVGFYKCI